MIRIKKGDETYLAPGPEDVLPAIAAGQVWGFGRRDVRVDRVSGDVVDVRSARRAYQTTVAEFYRTVARYGGRLKNS